MTPSPSHSPHQNRIVGILPSVSMIAILVTSAEYLAFGLKNNFPAIAGLLALNALGVVASSWVFLKRLPTETNPHSNLHDLSEGGEFESQTESELKRRIAVLEAEISDQNKNMERTLTRRTHQLEWTQRVMEQELERTTTLLNHSDNGALLIASNLRVKPQYSRACLQIFGEDIVNEDLPSLLFKEDKEAEAQFRRNLDRIFQIADDAARCALYVELLPVEILLNKRLYRTHFKMLSDQTVMLIMVDIQDHIELQSRIRRENLQTGFLLNALESRNDLLDALAAWKTFFETDLPKLLVYKAASNEAAAEVFRQIHTFKGLFGQEGFPSLTDALHALETHLSEISLQPDYVIEDFREAIEAANLEKHLDSDIGFLTDRLGKAYLSGGKRLEIPLQHLYRLETKTRELVANQAEPSEKSLEVLRRVRRIRFLPVRSFLNQHFKLAQVIADRLGKPIYPIECEGDEIWIDPDHFQPFFRSLVNVFRNAIDHGLEDAELRMTKGKDPTGRITCRVRAQKMRFELVIGDDGCGLNASLIRAKAVEQGLISEEKAKTLDVADIWHLIFEDNFTTRDRVSDISGRGIGLAAVMSETEKIGGTVSAHSEENKGFELLFDLPMPAWVGVGNLDE